MHERKNKMIYLFIHVLLEKKIQKISSSRILRAIKYCIFCERKKIKINRVAKAGHPILYKEIFSSIIYVMCLVYGTVSYP